VLTDAQKARWKDLAGPELTGKMELDHKGDK
jgi:hypothetical protein